MRSRPITTRLRATAMGVVLPFVALAGIGPGAQTASADVATADGAATTCEISGGTLGWGVKESFRAYITGTIANGAWEVSDGADYETPDFVWTDPTGQIDPDTGEGQVSFTGTVHFTGHDGVLDLVLANPTVEFEGDGGAALLLDARSNDMEGEVAVDVKQEWVGDVVVESALAPEDGTLELSDLPTTLTDSGAAAFAGFYEGGEDLDPVKLSLELPDCAAAAAPDAEEPTTEQAQPVTSDADVPWPPIIVGAAAILVLGLTIGILIAGRGSKNKQGQHSGGQDAT